MNITNSTSIRRPWIDFMNRSTATIAIETSTLLLIGLMAIGGNLLVVISIYRNPSLRTITNYFVFSLSVTDIIFPITVTPVIAVSSIKSRFVFERQVCNFQAMISLCLTYVSIITIVLMAVNRYLRVYKPHKYDKLFSRKASLSTISVVWISSCTVTTLLVWKGRPFTYAMFDPRKIICYLVYKNTTSKVLGNSIMFVVLVLPLTIIIYCYFKVFKKIRQHKRNIAPASSKPNGLSTSVQEIKTTWTLFAVVLGYCLTWIPVVVVSLASNIFSSKNLPRQAHMIVTYSGASSNVINPIIYGVLNKAFRREYAKIIRCQ